MKVPTPLQGWRVFAGEVGVIVLGVLLALGAQELVTDIGNRQRAADARTAISSEVEDHDFAAAEMEIVAPCIGAQVAAIQQRLVAGDTRPLPRFTDRSSVQGFAVRMPSRVWGGTAWGSIRDTDVLRELEPRFAELAADHYAQVAIMSELNRAARAEVSRLNALSLMMPGGEAERLRLIEAGEQVRSMADDMDLIAGQLRDRLARQALLLDKARLERELAYSGTIKFCQKQGLPLGRLRAANPKSENI